MTFFTSLLRDHALATELRLAVNDLRHETRSLRSELSALRADRDRLNTKVARLETVTESDRVRQQAQQARSLGS